MKEQKRKLLRWVSVGVFVVLAIVCGVLIPRTVVNYDMTKYLPEEAISKAGYTLYSEEFGGTNSAKIMVYTDGKTSAQYLEAFESVKLKKGNAIISVSLDGEKEGTALFSVIFSGRGTESAVKESADLLIAEAGENAAVCGTVIDDIATAQYMNSAALLASVILIPVIILLVMLTTKSFMSLLLVLATLGLSVVINLGTNCLLPSVSFITQGIALALQLAITLDYAIFMIHEYERRRSEGVPPAEAVKLAVKKSFLSICSAMLTTVAGFIALMFMKFSIGLDLGLVFIKGILFSFASVLLFLPAMLLICDKAVARTEHRPFMPKFRRTAKGIFKARYAFVFLVLLLVPALILQSKIEFQFGSASLTSGEKIPSYRAKLDIAEVYGRDNSVLILYPKTEDREKELLLTQKLESLTFADGRKMISGVTSEAGTLYFVQKQFADGIVQTIRGAAMIPGSPLAGIPGIETLELSVPYCGTSAEFVQSLSAQLIAKGIPEAFISGMGGEMIREIDGAFQAVISNFEGETQRRIVISADTSEEGAEAFSMYESVKTCLEESGFVAYFPVGETPSAYDMRDIMTGDSDWINALSVGLVFLIIAIFFRSFSIPIILILPILTGMYVNSAIAALMGAPVAFLGNLVVSLIQLGATIDYAILYANKYIVNRRTMGKKESSLRAIRESIPSVLTSAIALTVAGVAIGLTAALPATSQIGFMLGRAGILSAFFTIFVLPGLMTLFDPIFQKTSVGLKFLYDPAPRKREEYVEEEDD